MFRTRQYKEKNGEGSNRTIFSFKNKEERKFHEEFGMITLIYITVLREIYFSLLILNKKKE